MSVVINTNYAATVASNNLTAANSMLQKSLNRLSSGMKITSPADDAGGLGISMNLSAAARRAGAANSNIANSISYLQTQDGALKVAGKVLDRISELYTLYQDPTKNSQDKDNYDAEFTQLQAELTSLAGEKFNGIDLFGTGTTGLDVQVSEDGTQSVTMSVKDLTDTGSGGVGVLTDTSSVSSLSSIDSLSDITDALQTVAELRATNGAEQSRLNFASEVLTVNRTNLEAANSRIMDVDVAEESTQLARWNILVQSGTSMLTQANQSAQIALRLLQ
jgi:flagellin